MSDQFVPCTADTKKAFLVEPIREGLVVSRMVSKKGPGDIRSENADMSNDESCQKHDRLPVQGFLRSVNLRRVNWMRVRSRSRREMIKRTTKSDQINKSTPNPKRKTMGRKELTRQKPSRYAGRCEINRCWSSYNCFSGSCFRYWKRS